MNPAYRPMLATLVDEPFDSKDWVFETKWDDGFHGRENLQREPKSRFPRSAAGPLCRSVRQLPVWSAPLSGASRRGFWCMNASLELLSSALSKPAAALRKMSIARSISIALSGLITQIILQNR
jgi:hypothetical protein